MLTWWYVKKPLGFKRLNRLEVFENRVLRKI
jgi:hypothetical protein